MKYQLVVQFQADSIDDFEELMSFEDALSEKAGESFLLDGHDFGFGELNIFILTDHPDAAFRQVQAVVESIHPIQKMKVAYRYLGGKEFSILWPPNLKKFTIA